MYRILCYGDSNTWGFRPDQPFTRFPQDIRWTGVLRSILGLEHEIIEEGLNGRTTVWDDPFGDHKNGKTYLSPCLESHAELDLVIIMLGTNDLKAHFKLTAAEVAQGVKNLISIVRSSGSGRNGNTPEILVVAPPIRNSAALSENIGTNKNVHRKKVWVMLLLGNTCLFYAAENDGAQQV